MVTKALDLELCPVRLQRLEILCITSNKYLDVLTHLRQQ